MIDKRGDTNPYTTNSKGPYNNENSNNINLLEFPNYTFHGIGHYYCDTCEGEIKIFVVKNPKNK